MKKVFIGLLATIGIFAVSCQKEKPADSLTIGLGTINARYTGEEQTLTFTSNADWTASSSVDWVTVTPTSGSAGKGSIKLAVKANDTFSERIGNISIVAGDKKTKFSVRQGFLNEFGSGIDYHISALAQDISISVKTNIEYEVKVSENSSWLSVVQTKAAPELGTIKIHASANTELAPRTGLFTITGEGISVEYRVIQDAAYTVTYKAEAVYLKNTQKIYDTANWAYTKFKQTAITLTTESEDAVVLVLNISPDTDGKTIPAGTYSIDAANTKAANTFSIKSTNGGERYYTTIKNATSEIMIEDGEINIYESEGKYSVTAVLVDAFGIQHSYSYEGEISITDKSFGANFGASTFNGIYQTYFSTQVNSWEIPVYISSEGNNKKYVSYIDFILYGEKGEVADIKDIPVGEFTLSEEKNIESSYLNGILDAKPKTFHVKYITTIDGNTVSIKEGTSPVLKISKSTANIYTIEFTATLVETIKDEEGNPKETNEFEYSVKFCDLLLNTVNPNPMKVCPDEDVYIESAGFANKANGMYFEEPFVNKEGNLIVLGWTSTGPNTDSPLYIALYVDKTKWVFEKNFLNKYCNTHIPDGVYDFSAMSAPGKLLPIKFSGKPYCYYTNRYTGTSFAISGGSITLKDYIVKLDLKATAGEKNINIKGAFSYGDGLIRDWSKFVKKLSLDAE